MTGRGTGGEAGFVARAEVTGPPLADLAVSWGAAGLVRTLDGKAVPLAAYLGVLPVVIWTDREDEILAGVPERRRRMIDAGLVAERPDRVALLAAPPARARAQARAAAPAPARSRGLEPAARRVGIGAPARPRRLGGGARKRGCTASSPRARRPFPAIELRYEPSPAGGPDGAETLFESLAAVADDELRLGRPCIGPHLDRLSIVWGADRDRGESGPDVSRVASAGERKALGLLLVAAQAELLEAAGRPPTVLVDDVDAELDLGALEAVWSGPGRGSARCSRPPAGRRSRTG